MTLRLILFFLGLLRDLDLGVVLAEHEAMSRSMMLALLIDAVTGGFYVAITRGYLIPMYLAFKYNVALISKVLGLQAVITLIVLTFLYRLGDSICRRLRKKLLLAHFLERAFWASLPLAAPFLPLEVLFLTLANIVASLVGLYITYLAYAYFEKDDLIKLFSRRFALGALTSIIACVVAPLLIYALPVRLAYILAYLLAALVGWVGTATFFLTPFKEVELKPSHIVVPLEHVEIRKVNAFLFFFLFNIFVNIAGIIWIPLSKSLLGLSDREISLFPLLASVGTIIGSMLIKSVRACRVAAIFVVLTFLLLPLARTPTLNFLNFTIFELANISGFIATSIVYSGYVREIGHTKVSLLTQLGYIAGVAVASLLVCYLPQSLLYYVSIALGMLMLAIMYTAIPEISVMPETLTLSVARTVYTISITSGTYLMLLTREAISLFVRALALTLLIIILYVLYMLLTALLSA